MDLIIRHNRLFGFYSDY